MSLRPMGPRLRAVILIVTTPSIAGLEALREPLPLGPLASACRTPNEASPRTTEESGLAPGTGRPAPPLPSRYGTISVWAIIPSEGCSMKWQWKAYLPR